MRAQMDVDKEEPILQDHLEDDAMTFLWYVISVIVAIVFVGVVLVVRSL